MKNRIGRAGMMLVLLGMLLQSQMAGAQTYTVGVQNFEEYLPYSEYVGGDYKGFNRELLDLFAASKGYTFEYNARPVTRLYIEYLNGEFDFKYPDNPYWSANQKEGHDIKYSDAVVAYIDGVLVLPANKGKGVEHLKTLGVVRGFTPFAYLKLIKDGVVVVRENPTYEGLLKQTLMKRVGGAYSNIAVSQHYLRDMDSKDGTLVFDPDLPHTRSQRYLSSFKHPELIEEFNVFLKEHSDEVQALKDKYRVEEGL